MLEPTEPPKSGAGKYLMVSTMLLFDDFALDTERRELRGPDGLIAVEPQVFDLLAYLIRNRDRVVSKDEILAEIWSGRIVSPSALSSRINAARQAIGDSGETQRFIKTFPRVGVRFVVEVRDRSRTEVDLLEEGASRQRDATYHPALDNRPRIAVLPFSNLSGDLDQEYFADGMVEEIITALSHMRWVSVIARNSSFIYKGKPVDIREVGRDLGASYVLEGSVRRSKGRVRISGQLLDTSTGTSLWAGHFEGELEDVFELQDQIAENVVGAIAPRLGKAEISRARRKPTESLDAYDYYLRGLASVHRWTRDANSQALAELEAAIDLDPEFASAFGMAARCYSQRKSCGWMTDRPSEVTKAERLARKAAELGADDAVALCTAGIVLAYVVGDVSYGNKLIDRALELNKNLAWAWSFGSWVKIWQGEPELANERSAHAIRLSPNDPEVLFFMQTSLAYSLFLSRRFEEAFGVAVAAMNDRPNVFITMCAAAANGGLCGRLAEARRIAEQVRKLQPDIRLSDLAQLFPFQRDTDREIWYEGLRLCGLPE